ncbi:MAG: copper chaperone PCu(A)C [Reyranella sp.]|uniref:copper chaperone PCu(A)C n=1 Tax=Reyranella sp. TaxID=1929291 RepID=UPI0027319833|nr:copper chaperone PCu(A)C [Reyranella sp.]MDP1960579.1 copper chaperone PCu(A)C [Reyranella sp.]MDP2376726.1 copper chaperone PCu(A)C [Reyranella sp.]
MITRRLSLAAAIALLAVPAAAHDYKLGTLEISHPWTRATPATAQSGGGFLTITNKGTMPDRLVAARSGASDRVEIHEMKMDGNVMRMRELEKGLEIPAGATVMLKPGGFHIMFMGLKAPFAKDAKVQVTLVFEKAGSLDIALDVEALGASAPKH